MAHTDTKVFTAHIPLPLADKVDPLAARLDRSRGWVVKQALSAWIAQEEERSRLTCEALAMWTPGASSTIRPCRRGPTASARTSRCLHRADGTEVDQQGALRSGTAV